jgi:transcriptional regulator with XRE-family HTH domain
MEGLILAHSIKRYFQEVYIDKISDAIEEYIQEHPRELREKFPQLHSLGEFTLESPEVKAVYSKLDSAYNIDFEIAVCVTVDCVEGNHHYDDMREEECWFAVNGRGNLEKLLQDFSIKKVESYTSRTHHGNLNDSFVLNIKKNNLDAVAEGFLKRYYPEALEGPVSIDTDKLLARLNLTKIERRISADQSVFGRIYFESADVAFYEEENQSEIMHVEPGTVCVDPEVFFLRTMGSLNNTIVHECVHWVFHRPVYLLKKINNEVLTQLDCAVVGGVRGRKKWTDASKIEWQANALTPRIQMPAKIFKQKADELLEQLMKERQANTVRDVIEDVIAQLAEIFGVSRMSAKIRMVELGYEMARGAYIYLDGQYIRPFIYKEGTMKPDQTFCVSFKDAAILRLTSMDLRTDPRSNDFVYIDSHFVYNRPQYVKQTDNGLQMTDYALEHMDECCLVFKMAIASGCEKEYHTVCYFNRDTDSNLRFVVQYDSGLEKASQEEKDKAESEAIRAAYKRLNTLPAGYNYALKALIDESGMTIGEIADETYVSEKTIDRILKGDKDGGSYESLAYICLSLQLHPVISSFIIERSPWKCDFRKINHIALREALRSYYGHKMSFIHKKVAAFSA